MAKMTITAAFARLRSGQTPVEPRGFGFAANFLICSKDKRLVKAFEARAPC